MKKIITYGTFDLFHYGHLEILRRAKSLGDYLIVGISTDEFNEKEKNKNTVHSFAHRAAIVAANKYVDKVIPESRWNQKRDDVLSNDIDVFVMGNDWRGHFDEELNGVCKVVYLPRTDGVSSTDIKALIKAEVDRV